MMSFRRICILWAIYLVLSFPSARADEKPILKVDRERIPAATAPLELVQLPAGKITMKDKDGKDKAHEIKPVWISRTEITWEHYFPFSRRLDLTPEQEAKKVDAENRPSKPYDNPEMPWGAEGLPAGRIHYMAAQKYCAWLSKKTGKKYRLPTEAEWEYACRAGGPPVEMKIDELKPVAWFINNSEEQPQQIAKKKPNAWGIYDMLGNVCEWVVREDGTFTTAGGSYADEASDVSSSARKPLDPKWQRSQQVEPKGTSWLSDGPFVGFRVVREE